MRVLKMDQEFGEKTGGVLTGILSDSSHAEAVRLIEDLLGIDRDFPAALNLVDTSQIHFGEPLGRGTVVGARGR